jgi:D-serine deaminase-like pyridoxal phosphate-dependent protein
VAIHRDRDEIILYGGSAHFSKDFLTVNGQRNYGLVVSLNESGWKSSGSSFLSKLSQEHGTIKATKEFLEFAKVGDLVGVIPVHSCLAVDANRHLCTLDGKEINVMSKSSVYFF